MTTDYDASRKTDEELKEEQLEPLRLAANQDKTSGTVDQDETEAAEAFELLGADLSGEDLEVVVTPRQDDEFSCSRCHLVYHHAMLADSTLCQDCAA